MKRTKQNAGQPTYQHIIYRQIQLSGLYVLHVITANHLGWRAKLITVLNLRAIALLDTAMEALIIII